MRRSMRLRDGGGTSRWVRAVALAGLAILSDFEIVRAHAQEKQTLAGRVVDASGAGVAGARVWVLLPGPDAHSTVAEGQTDVQGKFSMGPLPASKYTEKDPWWLRYQPRGYELVARSKDGRFAWLGASNIRGEDPRNLTLPLFESLETQGRIVDQADRPIAGARIVPASLQSQGASYVWAPLPQQVSEQLGVTTAADGSFRLQGMPRDAQISARITTAHHGSADVRWSPGEKITIRLDSRLGRIKGRFKLLPGTRIDDNVLISLGTLWNENRWNEHKYLLMDTRNITVDPDGGFAVEGLQPGLYYLNAQLSADAPFLATRSGNNTLNVEPGATAVFPDIVLQPAVTLTGRVIDAETRKGVPGVAVRSFTFDTSGSNSSYVPPVQTDRDGRYRVHAGKGRVQVSVASLPEAYVVPIEDRPMLEVSGDRPWPDIALARAAVLEGIVVDQAGKAVAGAEVSVTGSVRGGMGSVQSVRSGPEGRFRVPQVAPTELLAIRARFPQSGAVSEGAVVVKMSQQKGPVTIKVDPRFAFRMHGTVADRSGKPLVGAKLSLQWRRQKPSDDPRRSGWMGSIWGKSLTTDASGRFQTDRLIPGDTYILDVTAKDHVPFQTDEIKGVAGLSRGLGTIKLAGTGGFLAGQVVGSDGKPIAGVTVFNRGNGLEKVSTRTDVTGRFRLDGLFPGHKYAFATKDGYRFTGTLADGDRSDLTIRLLRRDEPPTAWKPERGLSQEEGHALARRIVNRLWEIGSKLEEAPGRPQPWVQLVVAMAQIDPALALDWSAQQGGKLDTQVKLIGAEVVADYDAQAAIDVIRKTNDRLIALDKLTDLAARYADSDPDRARRFADEAATIVKGLPQAQRSELSARVGAVLIDLGRKDEGRKLVEEAVAALPPPAKPGAPVPLSNSFLTTVRALARYDLKRAQKLAESIHDRYINSLMLGFFAQSIARTDPGLAIELVKKEENARDRDTTMISIVYRCGAEHPDEALKLIAEMNSDRTVTYKAEALAWLAVAQSKRDPRRAADLIDQALAALADTSSSTRYLRVSGGPDVAAARVALLARRIGYPDMPSVIARVLATRSGPDSSIFRRVTYSGSLAALLALIDPATAREVLTQAEAGTGSLPARQLGRSANGLSRMSRPSPEAQLIDWALADRPRAEEKIDAALADVERAKENSSQLYALIGLAEELAASPARREEMLWGVGNDTWYPGRARPGE